MSDEIQLREGANILVCGPDGPTIRHEADCMDLIGEALGARADVVAVPVSRLAEEFFTLRTGVAGGIVQKFVNYHLVLAVVGDVSGHVSASTALRDYVHEANRGRHTWFMPSLTELDEMLTRIR